MDLNALKPGMQPISGISRPQPKTYLLITPSWPRVTSTEEGNLRCECPWEAGKLEAPLWRTHMLTLGTIAKDTAPVLL